MKEKKQSADWYIAATNWLTAGFVIPLIMVIAAAMVLGFIFGEEGIKNNQLLLSIFWVLYTPVVYWFGVMYSARYINKTYIVKDSNKIAKLTVLYLAIIGGGYRIFQIVKGAEITTEYIGFALALVAIYFASRKYIKISENIAVVTPPAPVQ